MDELLFRALEFAVRAHHGQRRKYSDTPYAWHPIRVAAILQTIEPDNTDLIAAGFLHDTLEDCRDTVSFDTLARRFNDTIANLVEEVTNVAPWKCGSRDVRKAREREHLAKASADGQTLKLADTIDNISRIARCPKQFADVYMAEKRMLLPVLDSGDLTLHAWADTILTDYFSGGDTDAPQTIPA